MSIATLKARFNSILSSINRSTTTNFSTTVETAYEALTLASVMNEYKRVYGNIANVIHPIHSGFLNQKPGKFRVERSFRIDFVNGETFFFAADVEVFGLNAFSRGLPGGMVFEADVVVIPENHHLDVINNFNGYPAPQHLHSAYECKFGSYNKSQLREFLGLKRHISFLGNGHPPTHTLFSNPIVNSFPAIALKMVRPRTQKFFDLSTATLYDLEQIIVI